MPHLADDYATGSSQQGFAMRLAGSVGRTSVSTVTRDDKVVDADVVSL